MFINSFKIFLYLRVFNQNFKAMHRVCLFIVFLILSTALFSQNPREVPSFEEVISLESVSNPKISPDGRDVVYQLRKTQWKKNGYDTEIWLADRKSTRLNSSHYS